MTGLLTGAEIKAAAIIIDDEEDGYRGASYDVRIENIIQPDGCLVDSYTLPPQGIVEVFSRERVELHTDIAGYALVKTGLCNEGLLALNIGVIDPGYSGRVSSALINFGKNDHLLTKGDVFLRLTFHRLNGKDGLSRARETDDQTYISNLRHGVIKHFSSYFLDLDAVTKRSVDHWMGNWKTKLFVWVPLMALFIAALTFFLNFGALWSIQRFFSPSDSMRAEIFRLQLLERADAVAAENQALIAKIDRLEGLIQELSKSNMGPPEKPTVPTQR